MGNTPYKAIEFIIKNSSEYAKAKAQRVLLEEFRKSKKALLMKDALKMGIETVSAQEREAYADVSYIELLHGLAAAIEKEEELNKIAENLNYYYGDKPSLTKVLKAIANKKLIVSKKIS